MNPINYAVGLLQLVKTGTKEHIAHAKAELTALLDELKSFEVSHLDDEVKALKASVIAEVEAALPKSK